MATSSFEFVNPVVAQQYLDTQKENRALYESRVERYATAMRLNHWVENGDSIRFNVRGELVDGQHRLRAIIVSGVTLRVLVVRGLPIEAQATIDSGKSRTLADFFKITGRTEYAALASAVSWFHRLHATPAAIIPAEVVVPTAIQAEEIAENTSIAKRVRTISNWRNSEAGRVTRSGPFGALYECWGDPATEFFQQVVTGLDCAPPAWQLRRALLSERQKLAGYFVTALVIKSYAIHCGKKPATKILAWRRGETAEPFPDWRALISA